MTSEPMVRSQLAEEDVLRCRDEIAGKLEQSVDGFDINEAVAQLRAMRCRVFESDSATRDRLHDVIDDALASIVRRYADLNERARASGRYLDQATRILSSSVGYRETLEQLAQLAVPDLADWCIVDLLEGGRLEHVAIVHSDARKLELARDYARRYPPDPDGRDGGGGVLRTGEPRLASEITDEMIAASARSPEHLDVLRELGFKSWIGVPLVGRGETIGVLHLITSSSGRRFRDADLDLARELGQRAGLAVDNARLYRDAQAAVRGREDILAIVSHDLRNPLGAIDLAATLLATAVAGDARASRHLDAIRRSANRMERLIGDLLDMASINAGKLAIEPSPVEAGELVNEVLDLNEPLASQRGIRLLRDCRLDGVQLNVDRNRITQVFNNLLGNALKFCKDGDVIAVRAAHDGDRVQLSFSDSGPGISGTELPHIFEPYWSGRGQHAGTGLGLFISKAIVEAHGGDIAVSSIEGRGATFALTLPTKKTPQT